MSPPRPLEVLALAGALALPACASARGDSERRIRERTDFVVASTEWLTAATSAIESLDDLGAAPSAATASPALEPESPWLATIGLRSLLPGAYEYGLGICLPNFGNSRVEEISPDPLRTLAVGVWLKFDF
jgi:hypothetical protein